MNTRNKLCRFVAITILAIAAMAMVACSEERTHSTMKLELNSSLANAKLLAPSGVPLEVTKYVISGSGPQGSVFNVESASSTVTVEGLLIGNWTLTATGRNNAGVDMVRGSTTFQLSSSPTTTTLELSELVGKGMLRVSFEWDPSRISNARLDLELAPQGGSSNSITPTSIDLIGGSATYVGELNSGSYVVQARLYDGNTVVAGCVEAIRIVGGKTTEGSVTLTLDKYPDNPGSIRLVNKLGIPVECTISGISSKVTAMKSITTQLDVPDSISSSELQVAWYLDGNKAATGTSYTFTPKAGEHRLDVVAQGPLLGSVGSTSVPFLASLEGTAGVPQLVASYANGDNSLNLSGTTSLAFTSDGTLILGNTGSSTLQIANILKDTITVGTTYRGGNGFSTVGITDVLVVPDTDYVITAETSEPGVSMYTYNPTGKTLTPKYHRDGILSTRATFTGTSTLVYDRYEDAVLAADPTSKYLPAVKVNAQSLEEWKMGWMTLWGTTDVPFTKGTAAATSPGDWSMAVISKSENAIKLLRRTSMSIFGYDCLINYNATGATGLSGVRSVAFSDDNNAITGAASLLSRFTFVSKNVWTQTQSIKAGEASGIRAMSNIDDIILSPNGKYLYVLCSGSKNVNVFTMGSDGTLNYIGELDCQEFAPTHGAVTPNGEYLVLTSSISNEMLLCRIPK